MISKPKIMFFIQIAVLLLFLASSTDLVNPDHARFGTSTRIVDEVVVIRNLNGGSGNPCFLNSDCNLELHCDWLSTEARFFCAPKKGNNQSCLTNSDFSSGLCKGFFCENAWLSIKMAKNVTKTQTVFLATASG